MARRRRADFVDWIERTIRLPVGLAAEPGPIRLAPYMREIAAAMTAPGIERVTIMKSARIGFSTVLDALIAHHMTEDPAAVLVVLPAELDARNHVVRLEDTFENSPVLKGRLPTPSSAGRSERNTMLFRRGANGASLRLVGATAPRNLRAITARILLIDEADALPDSDEEGSAIRLSEMRTLTFANRRIVCGGTPLAADVSHVAREYAQSDQRIFEVRCANCGAFHEIKWPDIEWPEGQPERATWRCPSCKQLIGVEHKSSMVAQGRWRATALGSPGHVGFKINSLVSPLWNARWGKLVAEWIKACDNPDERKVFLNTVLGEPWEGEGDEIDEDDLRKRAEPFSLEALPQACLAITAGVDVQRDRFEITFAGWTKDGAMFVLGHEVVWGETGTPSSQVWIDLDDLLRSRFKHPTGSTLGVDAACVDGGDGGMLDTVLKFATPRWNRRIVAIKGQAGFSRRFIQRGGRHNVLHIVGVDAIKAQLFDRLRNPRSIRFSRTLDAEWFAQLTSEKRIVKMTGGKPVARFERKVGFRAEALDCTVYAIAARALLSLNFDQRADALALHAPVTRRQTVFRSEWMSR